MTVRLRTHHLLCILTHVGKGYSPAFVQNMADIVARISAGEEIEIVEGPDDICAPLCANRITGAMAHCHRNRVSARDRIAVEELGAVLQVSPKPGARLVLDAATVRTLRKDFTATRIRSACAGCRWHGLCTSCADGDYDDTSL